MKTPDTASDMLCAIFAGVRRLTLLALALWASQVGAAPKLAVAEPLTPPEMVGLGAQVANWVAAAAQTAGTVVMGPEDLERTLGEPRYAELQACRGTPHCIAALGLSLRVPRLVVGTLDRDEQSYLLHLWLLELPSARVVGRLDRPVRIATRRFGQEVRTALPGFLRGEAQERGQLELSASVAGASVEIDGSPSGFTPIRLSLSPGRHELEVQKQGFLPAHRWITVAAGKATQEEVRLLRIPGADEGLAPEANIPFARPSGGGAGHAGWQIPLGTYIAGGIAVAAAGVGIGLGVSSDGLERRLRTGFDRPTQVYAGTRAEALTGRSQALAANIMFATAGAAAVTALGFALLTPAPEIRAAIAPDPHGIAVSLGGQF